MALFKLCDSGDGSCICLAGGRDGKSAALLSAIGGRVAMLIYFSPFSFSRSSSLAFVLTACFSFFRSFLFCSFAVDDATPSFRCHKRLEILRMLSWWLRRSSVCSSTSSGRPSMLFFNSTWRSSSRAILASFLTSDVASFPNIVQHSSTFRRNCLFSNFLLKLPSTSFFLFIGLGGDGASLPEVLEQRNVARSTRLLPQMFSSSPRSSSSSSPPPLESLQVRHSLASRQHSWAKF